MGATLAAILFVVVLYCLERLSIELISAGTVAAFVAFFAVFGGDAGPTTEQLLAGFANPALIAIIALLVVGQGMFQTGALEGVTQMLVTAYDTRPRSVIAAMFGFVFLVSAFLNNTPVVVMFVPILAAMAQRMGASPSKVMMPLSFVSVLAGMTTLIGSSTNLLVAESLRKAGETLPNAPTLGFFTQTPMGLILASAGAIYLVFFGRRLLPDRQTLERELTASGKQFIAQIAVTPGHPLDGAKPVAGMFPALGEMTVRLVQRGENALLPPYENVQLRPGDLVIVAATRKLLADLLARSPEILRGLMQTSESGVDFDDGAALAMSEAVVAPASRLIGRTIEQSAFRYQTGCVVLGVERRSRMIRSRLGDIRLEAGDVLLVLGGDREMRDLRVNRDVLPLEWSTAEIPDKRKAHVAAMVFLGVIAGSASGLLPIVGAALLGAVLMVATGCLNARQAVRAIDVRVYLLISAAFSMGVALQETGAADWLAQGVVSIFAGWGTAALISALFLLVALLTNVLSNSATAILFAPIAINAAALTGDDPTVYVLTVIFAANCSFATPIAYQTNLLVMGPGHYRFADYAVLGAPLVIILWIVFSLVAPWYFNLG
ncbi:MAG: SLC13 family permease [Maricaulaceae bacterium]